MRELLKYIFPICMVWVCAWLHINVQYRVYDNIWNNYDTVGFMLTPYGFALAITIIIVEMVIMNFTE